MPIFNDILTPLAGTKVLARYGNSYYAGEAAVTEKATGKGRTIHFGSTFSQENVKSILDYVGVLKPFRDYVEAPETVELVMRKKKEKRFLFVLNFQPETAVYTLKKEAVLLYTGEKAQGECRLEKYGTAVYEFKE